MSRVIINPGLFPSNVRGFRVAHWNVSMENLRNAGKLLCPLAAIAHFIAIFIALSPDSIYRSSISLFR